MTAYRGSIEDVPKGRYGCILADPEWLFLIRKETTANVKKSPQHHYKCSALQDIMARPVGQLAARNCLLCLWTTAPHLQNSLYVMAAWGFRYSTIGAWAKEGRSSETFTFGGGFVLRSSAEFFLIGMRGHPKIKSKSVRNLIFAPRREHSRKPDQIRTNLMKLVDGPYLELNARQESPGWDAWGDEVGKFEGGDD